MAGTFSARIDELAAQVGVGSLKGAVGFDQAYAHRQHEDLTLKHVRGSAKYLERALFDNIPEEMTALAQSILTVGPKDGMILVVERLADRAESNAPRRERGSGVLSNSAHPTVSDNDELVYDRPPRAARLSPEEIEERNMELQDPEHYYGEWPPPLGSRDVQGRWHLPSRRR